MGALVTSAEEEPDGEGDKGECEDTAEDAAHYGGGAVRAGGASGGFCGVRGQGGELGVLGEGGAEGWVPAVTGLSASGVTKGAV